MKIIVLYTMLFVCSIIFGSSFVFAQENSSMTVEVDLIDFNGTSNASDISIEVPDYIDLGQVSKNDPVSNEPNLYINNTGKINISVTPVLKDPEEGIFKWLFFRTQKSDKEGIYNISEKIGDFSFSIDKPSTGNSKKTKNVYIHLNLTDFNGVINEDVNDYRSQVIFFAIPG